jgi:hypothetical protein
VFPALNKKRGKIMEQAEAVEKIVEEKPRAAKKYINLMVTDGILEYWSSGSTSMYGLKGTGKQSHGEGED